MSDAKILRWKEFSSPRLGAKTSQYDTRTEWFCSAHRESEMTGTGPFSSFSVKSGTSCAIYSGVRRAAAARRIVAMRGERFIIHLLKPQAEDNMPAGRESFGGRWDPGAHDISQRAIPAPEKTAFRCPYVSEIVVHVHVVFRFYTACQGP